MRKRLDRELGKVKDRIVECIGPYARFVAVEEEKIATLSKELGDVERRVAAVRARLSSS